MGEGDQCPSSQLLKTSYFAKITPVRGDADIAQWLERLFCKQRVVGSNPSVGSITMTLHNDASLCVYKIYKSNTIGFYAPPGSINN